MKKMLAVIAGFLLGYTVHAQTISTIAGGGTADPGDGGQATDCLLDHPSGIVIDAAGNYYFCERDAHRVRKVATDGTITTYAGTGVMGYDGDGGQATNAKVNSPYSIAIDAAGNIYVGEASPAVRKITPAGIISTVAGNGTAGYSGDGGLATLAAMDAPSGVAVDAHGNLYIAELDNHIVRKVGPDGIISTIAGDGTSGFSGDGGQATAARLRRAAGVAVDAAGNIFIADANNHRIRKISPSGIITTVAGSGAPPAFGGDGGPATAGKLNSPIGIAVDNTGNLFIGDTYNYRVRRVSPIGIISTLAGDGSGTYNGDGSPATNYRIYNPTGIAVRGDGSVLVCDMFNNRIRRISGIVAVPEIRQEANHSLVVYPNPSTGKFLISHDELVGAAGIYISDMAGRIIRNVTPKNGSVVDVDITGVPPGLYIVTAQTPSGIVSGKVITVLRE